MVLKFVPFVVVLLVAFSPFCRSAERAHSATHLHSYDLTAGLDCAASLGLLYCLKANERSAILRQGTDVVRSSDKLCLLTRRKRCFEDKAGLYYVYLQNAGRHFVIAEIEQTGGYTVLLVNDTTGQIRRIDARPLFAPSGLVFATVSYDTDAGYVPNRVVVWSTTTPSALHIVDDFMRGIGPTSIRWVAPVKLEAYYSTSEYSAASDGKTKSFFVWRNDEGAWRDSYEAE